MNKYSQRNSLDIIGQTEAMDKLKQGKVVLMEKQSEAETEMKRPEK